MRACRRQNRSSRRNPAQPTQIIQITVVRIEFECRLAHGGGVVVIVDRLQDAPDFVEVQQRGGAAADIDRLDGFVAVLQGVVFDLGAERLHERGVRLLRRHEIEIAIDAALRAKRDMEVEAGHRWF